MDAWTHGRARLSIVAVFAKSFICKGTLDPKNRRSVCRSRGKNGTGRSGRSGPGHNTASDKGQARAEECKKIPTWRTAHEDFPFRSPGLEGGSRRLDRSPGHDTARGRENREGGRLRQGEGGPRAGARDYAASRQPSERRHTPRMLHRAR
jgi:hypothetical protein